MNFRRMLWLFNINIYFLWCAVQLLRHIFDFGRLSSRLCDTPVAEAFATKNNEIKYVWLNDMQLNFICNRICMLHRECVCKWIERAQIFISCFFFVKKFFHLNKTFAAIYLLNNWMSNRIHSHPAVILTVEILLMKLIWFPYSREGSQFIQFHLTPIEMTFPWHFTRNFFVSRRNPCVSRLIAQVETAMK